MDPVARGAGPEVPTVVLVAQLGCGGAIWKPVLDRLAGIDVVTYDRPGTGSAPPRTGPNGPRPYSSFARELADFLECEGVTGPVLLVGHSIGALIARLYASLYPHRVAGLVFVDGSIPQYHLHPTATKVLDGDGQDATEFDVVQGQVEVLNARLPIVPALVLTRTYGRWDGENTPPHPAVEDLWLTSQRALAAQMMCQLLIAGNAGHQMQREAPELVAYAIRAVHTAAVEGNAVTVSPIDLPAVGGKIDHDAGSRPTVVLIGGYAGSGKTELSRLVARRTGWATLDKDTLSPVVEAGLIAAGASPDDRETSTYLQLRPSEYEALIAAVIENVRCGVSVVASAPFIREFCDEVWCERVRAALTPFRAQLHLIWVKCDPASMHAYLVRRGATRDAAKLAAWDHYLEGVDLDYQPAAPYHLVDNSQGGRPLEGQAAELVARATGQTQTTADDLSRGPSDGQLIN
jgi:pimeloyl-ACP methyl ester carboxylesterase/predicted kinase